jgi:hypothetical protein
MRYGLNSMANCCDCEEFRAFAKTTGVVAAADMHTQMVKRVVTTTTTNNRLIISIYLLYLPTCLSVCVCGVKS